MSQFLPEENKRKTSLRFHGMMGIFMGLLYLIIAGITAYRMNAGMFPNGVFEIGENLTWILVGVFAAYGIFRIFRGIKVLKSI